MYGAKRVYLLGLTGAVVFAALTAVAWSAASLIVFRVLGAAEGAATGSASMALIMRAFPPTTGSRRWAGGRSSARARRCSAWSPVGRSSST